MAKKRLISKNLKHYLILLEHLTDIKNKPLRLKLVRWFSKNDNFNQAIREISLNIANGNLQLGTTMKRKLRPYAKLIVKLSGANDTNSRRKLVNQSGGYLNIALPAILGLIQALR